MNSQKNRAVLITGATSGIGFEIARLFAQDNRNLVLVSRSEDALYNVAAQLKNEGAGNILVIPKDLSAPRSAEEIYAQTEEAGIEVNILVNNAGMGEYGFFHETDLEKELSIIQLNAVTMVHLTKLYLKNMHLRNEGRILQVGSVASYLPTPKMAVYAATKAFILAFSDALINELQKSNVTMTVLMPGPTDTDFFNKAGMENTVAAQSDLEDPVVVARIGYEALMTGERHALCHGVRRHAVANALLRHDHIAAIARKPLEEKKQ